MYVCNKNVYCNRLTWSEKKATYTNTVIIINAVWCSVCVCMPESAAALGQHGLAMFPKKQTHPDYAMKITPLKNVRNI